MSLLKEEDRKAIKEELSGLQHAVTLLLFTQEFECQYCRESRQLAEEVSRLSDQVSLEVYDLQADADIAVQYGIDKIPALVVMRGGEEPKDFGIRFFGIPSGYEFGTFIEDIKIVGSGQSGLSEETKQELAALETPVHFQVFVTPTCPYCPRAVLLAHQMAMENDLIRADMVEAIEFPHLSTKYEVRGVPRTVINETEHLEGAVPEQMVLAKLRQAI